MKMTVAQILSKFLESKEDNLAVLADSGNDLLSANGFTLKSGYWVISRADAQKKFDELTTIKRPDYKAYWEMDRERWAKK
jgi:hypothetical protein